MESQQEICITVKEAARHIGSSVRQTDRFIKAGEKRETCQVRGRSDENKESREVAEQKLLLVRRTHFPESDSDHFGQFSTAAKRAWAAREGERGHEHNE